ncbi:MAG: glycosyltransferase [bacterium]
MTPLVSIGMPVFNGEDYVDGAIRSLLAQTFSDFELIISDNASTDSTADICREHAEKDERIRLLTNEKNLGAAENYNRVFRASSGGKYFKWAAHDDLCAPEFLERCIAALERDDGASLCYPRSEFIDARGNSIGVYEEDDDFTADEPTRRFRSWLFERSGPWCNAVFGVIRSEVLARTPLIGKYNSSDVILLGELALRGKLVRIPEVLFSRRDHPGRSVLAHKDSAARAAWFDPESAGKLQLPAWRWLGGYLGSVWRAPLGIRQRFDCYGLMARWMVRWRSQLKQDVVNVSKKIAGRGEQAA